MATTSSKGLGGRDGTDSQVGRRIADCLVLSLVSYADFVFVGFLHFLRRTVGDEKFRRVGEWEPELMVLYKACEEWLQRDSY